MNKHPKVGIKKEDFITITSKLSDVLYNLERLEFNIGIKGPTLEELDSLSQIGKFYNGVDYHITQESWLLIKNCLDLLIENKNNI